jgi:ketosteroid isomerase-like protein
VDHEGVELVRETFRRWDGNGLDGFAGDLWHSEAEYREDPMFPGSGTYRGQEAVRARFTEYLEVLGEPALEVESVEAGTAAVLALWGITGRTERGVPFEQRWAWVVRIRDGRISEVQAYIDRDAARADAGL